MGIAASAVASPSRAAASSAAAGVHLRAVRGDVHLDQPAEDPFPFEFSELLLHRLRIA